MNYKKLEASIRIVENLLKHDRICKYNNQRIQDFNTQTCGLYCLFYSYYASRSCSLANIVYCFDEDLDNNECIVKEFTLNYVQTYEI